MLLVINPGSTSTKIAIFKDEKKIWSEVIRHPIEELQVFKKVINQSEDRKRSIEQALKNSGHSLHCFSAIVGRGGLLKPIPGGTYIVNEKMVADLKKGTYGEHASNLGALIALELAKPLKLPAYIVDPVVVDEMEPVARLSGLPELPRKSIFHALNQRAIARRFCQEYEKTYDQVNLIIAHLGGGISVAVHQRGRVVDVNNALDGDGPFSPERAGSLPVGGLVRMCTSGKHKPDEIAKKLAGKGGLVAYLGTNDARVVEQMINVGNEEATMVYKAMAYQVAKEIGACATVLAGNVDGIILTGGLAHSKRLTDWIIEKVNFLASVTVYPGEDEMSALAAGALRVLKKEEKALVYS